MPENGSDDGKGKGRGGRAARVKETGIALVHAGEVVLPAAGSEAQAERVSSDARTVIEYHFPVEIEVRAAPEAGDSEELVNEVLRRLTEAVTNS